MWPFHTDTKGLGVIVLRLKPYTVATVANGVFSCHTPHHAYYIMHILATEAVTNTMAVAELSVQEAN